MRLLLIRQTASFFAPSLGNGIGIIATITHDAGHEVKVIDNNSHYKFYNEKEFIKIIQSFKPDVIGFSISLMNASLSYSLLKRLKQTFPEIIFIAGGIHMKHSYEEALREGSDVVVNHEGELVILPLLDHLQDRTPNNFCYGLDRIAGISYINSDGELHKPHEYPVIQNIDDIPFINYDLFNLKDFFKTKKEPGVISICCQRGCPFKCTFCSDDFLRRDRRVSSAEYLFKYVEYIHNKYRRKLILINDNNFAYPRKRAIEFCNRIINSSLHKNVKFSIQTKVETAHDEELIKLFKEAGVVSFALGIERMESSSKKMINKTTKESKIFHTLDLIKKFNMTVRINGILGFPFETEHIIKHERDAFLGFTKYTNNISLSILMPQPGTIYYDNYPKAEEWYLSPKIISLWRSYFTTALDISSLYHVDQNYFNLSDNHKDIIKKAFVDFKNIEHAYYLPSGLLSKAAKTIDNFLIKLSKALFNISPSLEFSIFNKIKFLRYYFGSIFFGDKVFES